MAGYSQLSLDLITKMKQRAVPLVALPASERLTYFAYTCPSFICICSPSRNEEGQCRPPDYMPGADNKCSTSRYKFHIQ